MKNDDFITGTFARLFRIGETAGRVGLSLLQRKAVELLKKSGSAQTGLDQILAAVDTLSRLKGAPMKIGQMLSLHEDLLPPEITQVFKLLQSDAKPAPFTEMKQILKEDLGDRLSQFTSIDEQPFASASIGQVHRATTKDGQSVVLKIQYQGIQKAMDSDLKSLRFVFASLFQVLELPFDAVWSELVARLSEELNYEAELHHLERYTKELAVPGIVVPVPVAEFCSSRVLTMTEEPAMSLDEALQYCRSLSKSDSETLRESWSQHLLSLVVRGLFELRFLHADPNAANFGFRKNGDLVLYDLGCMKEVPPAIASAYLAVAKSLFTGQYTEIPQLLQKAGIQSKDGTALPIEMLLPHFQLIEEVFPDQEAVFGSDATVYAKITELGRASFKDSKLIEFPADILFIHRTFIGHFGNLRRLAVKRNWRKTFSEHLP